MLYTMTHYVTRTADGLIHVQNAVAGMMGQHHVHDEESYRTWTDKIDPACIKKLDGSECDCGLRTGEQRSGG